MKVQYTIPGFDAQAELAAARAPRSAFQGKPAEIGADPPVSWEQILRLEPSGPGAGLEPPPRPAGLSFGDAEQERERWNDLLDRNLADPPPQPETRKMLALLLRYREARESVWARSLAEGAK